MGTDLVRTRSSGERARLVITAAAAATPREAHGYGDAISTSLSRSVFKPRSGTSKTALSRLRDQFSSSDCRTVYTKVAFVPFQVPQAPSDCHSCDRTSLIESGRLILRIWGGRSGFLVDWGGESGGGVVDLLLLVRAGEGVLGAVEVK
jgi:hypothetical protein